MPELKGFQDGLAVIGFPHAKRYEVLAGGEGYIAHPNPHDKLCDRDLLQQLHDQAQKPETQEFYQSAMASLDKVRAFQQNGIGVVGKVAEPQLTAANTASFTIKGNDFSV